ncbi:MAG TPA: hypothetical protein DIS79_01815 [Bacteroidetes bacterium]|nr:hypothetical protein [Bacteroidota bacterium]HRK03945.1 hypothetical protein [Chlorobiota bacterium]
MTPHVLFIELSDHHDEVLLSYTLDALALGWSVTIVCTESVKDRLPLPDTVNIMSITSNKNLQARISLALRLRTEIRHRQISHVVFVTTGGTAVRDLAMLLPRSMYKIGVAHDTGKLSESINQRIVSTRMKAFTVLADFVLDDIPTPHKPVYVVPATSRLSDNVLSGVRPATDTFDIVIPGHVEWSRKAYADILRSDVLESLPDHVRFVVLGGLDANSEGGQRLLLLIRQLDTNRIVTFDRRVDHIRYQSWAQKASVILPLLHPSCPVYSEYTSTKISGAMSTAWAFGIPLLLERGFERHESLHPGTMFYDVDDLPAVLLRLVENPLILDEYRGKQPTSSTAPQRRRELARALDVDVSMVVHSNTGELS